jgi:hypothetical protein
MDRCSATCDELSRVVLLFLTQLVGIALFAISSDVVVVAKRVSPYVENPTTTCLLPSSSHLSGSLALALSLYFNFILRSTKYYYHLVVVIDSESTTLPIIHTLSCKKATIHIILSSQFPHKNFNCVSQQQQQQQQHQPSL